MRRLIHGTADEDLCSKVDNRVIYATTLQLGNGLGEPARSPDCRSKNTFEFFLFSGPKPKKIDRQRRGLRLLVGVTGQNYQLVQLTSYRISFCHDALHPAALERLANIRRMHGVNVLSRNLSSPFILLWIPYAFPHHGALFRNHQGMDNHFPNPIQKNSIFLKKIPIVVVRRHPFYRSGD